MIVIVSNDRTYLVLHSVVSPVICGLYYWPLTYTGCIWVIILNYHFHGSHYTWSGVETYLLGVSITAIIVCVKGGALFDTVIWWSPLVGWFSDNSFIPVKHSFSQPEHFAYSFVKHSLSYKVFRCERKNMRTKLRTKNHWAITCLCININIWNWTCKWNETIMI